MIDYDARVTVVGGGAIGAASVYFLAKAGWTNIQLIEASQPGSATSSQAAGLLGQSRTTLERTEIAIHTAQILRELESETGFTPDWNECGSLRLAISAPAVQELRDIAAVAEQADLVVELVDGQRAAELFGPLERYDQIALALWVPTDGYVQPNSLINAYLGGARALGATVVSNTRISEILLENGTVTGLLTADDRVIETDVVVNAAGPWAGALTKTVGLELPVVPVSHQYFVTEPVDGWHNDLPCLRIPELQIYARGEGSSILCGGFEHHGASIDPTSVETDSPLVAKPRWETLGEFADSFAELCPSVGDAGIRTVFRGWPGFTPDGKFLVGPVSAVPGLVMAAGCNAHGVSGSAGLARHLVESLTGDASRYVQSLSPDRYVPRTWDWAEARVQAQAICENYYPLPRQANQ